MGNKFFVSLAPHIHGGDSIEKKMYGVLIALLPALAVSVYVFGVGALVVTGISVLSCVLFEYVLQRFVLKVQPTVTDGSAILTGLLLAFNLPSNLPFWTILIGAMAAIGIGKMSFGGLGNNPFNPAIVGRVFLLISFPSQMTTWPNAFERSYVDASTGATPLDMVKNHFGDLPSFSELLMGQSGGSLGELGALALLLGGLFMLYRGIITWHIPVVILLTAFVSAFCFSLLAPESFYAYQTGSSLGNALAYAGFHLVSGGMMLGAFFMATDYVTSPMTPRGQLLYAFGIGLITILIRVFGAYPEGMSFAIFLMNGVTPLINTYIKPKRFGEVRK